MNKFWKSAGKWLPGVLISLIAIALIIKFVDFQRLVQAIQNANYRLLILCPFISLVWLLVRGQVWRTLLRNKATFKQSFLTICEGYLLNNFLPFRLGEVGRAFLMGRKARMDFMEVLPTVVIERAVDLAYSAAILLGVIPFIAGSEEAGKIAILLGAVVLLGLVTLFILARRSAWALGLFNRLTGRWPRLQKLGDSFLEPLFAGLGILTDAKLFFSFLAWMTLDWGIAIVQYYVLTKAFFPQAQLTWGIFGLGVLAFGNAIPSAPGAVGTYEGALSWALTIVSHNASAALAVALTSHLISYFNTGIIGAYALSTEGETLMSIYRQLRRRQAVPEQE